MHDIRIGYLDALNAKRGFGSGVYFIYDGSELLYIGKAANIKQRLADHLVSNKTGIGKFIAGNRSIAEKLSVAIQQTNASEIYEAFWIMELKPRLNNTIHRLEYGPEVPPIFTLSPMVKGYLDALTDFEYAIGVQSGLMDKALSTALTDHKLDGDTIKVSQDWGLKADFSRCKIASSAKGIIRVSGDVVCQFGVGYLLGVFDGISIALGESYNVRSVLDMVMNHYGNFDFRGSRLNVVSYSSPAKSNTVYGI